MGRLRFLSSIVANRWTALWEILASAVQGVPNTPKRCLSFTRRILLARQKALQVVCKPSPFTSFKQSPTSTQSWQPQTRPTKSTFRATKTTKRCSTKIRSHSLNSEITKFKQSPETAVSMKTKPKAVMQAPSRPQTGQGTITRMARFWTSTLPQISIFTTTALSSKRPKIKHSQKKWAVALKVSVTRSIPLRAKIYKSNNQTNGRWTAVSSITLHSICPPWLSTPEVFPRGDPSQSRGLTRFQTAISRLKWSKMSCQKPSKSRRHTTKHSKHRSSISPSNSNHGDLTKLATRCSTAKGFKTISSPMKRPNYVSRATMRPKTNPS